MYKKYSDWFKIKKYVNNSKSREYFYEREVWNSYLGCNIGYEQDGAGDNYLRPVVIYKKFNKECALVIPLTSQNKVGKYYRSVIIKRKRKFLILSQLRFIDSKRLLYQIDKIGKKEYKTIKSEIMTILS